MFRSRFWRSHRFWWSATSCKNGPAAGELQLMAASAPRISVVLSGNTEDVGLDNEDCQPVLCDTEDENHYVSMQWKYLLSHILVVLSDVLMYR